MFIVIFSLRANSRLHSIYGSFINDALNSAFRPIPELNRTDADVMLIGIHSRALYSNPVYDPVFKSTTSPGPSAKYYSSDLTIGLIGCTEQYQFCNGHNKCSTPNALYSITNESVLEDLNYNPVQLATFETLSRTAYYMRLFSIQFMIDDNVLLAKDDLYGF
jgi:hypothetical protein